MAKAFVAQLSVICEESGSHHVLVKHLKSEDEAENCEDPPVGFALWCEKKGLISHCIHSLLPATAPATS